MRHVPALVRRELSAYFLGPMAYLILLAFQFIALVNFIELMETLGRPRSAFPGTDDPINLYIPGSVGFWIALLIAVPLLTMRLVAEERRSGTLETLLTVPVTEVEVIVSKWLAGALMYLALLLPFFFYLPFLYHFGKYEFDPGPVLGLAIGLGSMGLMFVAIGLFFSSLTKNQIVAAIGTFAAMFVVLILAMVQYGTALRRSSAWGETLRYLTVVSQLREFAAGQVDLRYLALHLSIAAFFVWLAVQVLRVKRES